MCDMKKRQIIALCFITTLNLLFSSLSPTMIRATPQQNIEITTVDKQTDKTELTIAYDAKENSELILKTSEKKMLDLKFLKEELGENNVINNSDEDEFKLTLDKLETGTLKLRISNQKHFILSILDAKENLILDKEFNQVAKQDIKEPEKISETPTSDEKEEKTPEEPNSDTKPTDEQAEKGFDEDQNDLENNNADEATWIRSDNLRVSQGPMLEYTDGSKIIPYLYFGDYLAANNRESIISLSAKKGASRKDSLTAPNSAVFQAERGVDISRGPGTRGTHIYTSHYGDNQSRDSFYRDLKTNVEEDKPYGSPGSFTSNTLYNYVEKTDSANKPGMSGPDKYPTKGDDAYYAMMGTPQFYYRVNAETGFEEQRMVFMQQAFRVKKGKRPNPQITTTIKMRFDNAGKVITTINYKNTGRDTFEKFIGFSNHDLSLNKDGDEITMYDSQGKLKKIGNYIPMRSLGDNRGMYIQSTNNEVRTSFYLNHQNGPEGWAARSIGKSYVAEKGFMEAGIVLGAIGYMSERYFPWKIGKTYKDNTFFDKDTRTYRSPYVPSNLFNSFNTYEDRGDRGSGKANSANARLGTEENGAAWDSGLVLRTSPKTLVTGESVTLEYASKTDVPGKTFSPVLEIDQKGTDDNPELLALKRDDINISGSWYDFDSTLIKTYYTIDDENKDHATLFDVFGQTTADRNSGKIHTWKNTISVKDLDKGKHKLRIWAQDNEGHLSSISEHVFKFIKPATKAPQIHVISPHSALKEPHNPVTHNLTVKGIWADKDSKKIKSITYKIDDEPEVHIEKDLANTKPSKFRQWQIEEKDITQHNDFDLHTMRLKIIDSEGNEGTDNFHFQHVPGNLQLTAPHDIEFGTHAVSSTTPTSVKPAINDGKVLLEDYRDEHSGPVGVTLSIDKFYKEEPHPDNPLKPNNRDEREFLPHEVYWKKQLVNTNNLLIGDTGDAKNNQWQEATDFTDEVLNNLKINFQAHPEGQSNGKYVSHWTWQIVDSMQ